jgi:CRP-like cAMP-binding protein
MDSERAREIMSAYVKEQFGKVVELREISIARSSAGRVWVGGLICVTSKGDIEVGSVNVTEEGKIGGGASPESSGPETDFSDIGLVAEDLEGDGARDSVFGELDDFFMDSDHSDLRDQINKLVSSGAEEDLIKARESIPQLLVHPLGRGSVLKQMGEIELKLGNARLGLEYLESAAREFSDLADIEALKQVAESTAGALGQEAYSTSPIKALFEHTLDRMKPIDRLDRIPAFLGLGDEELFEITGAAELIRVDSGEVILKEGDAAVRAFVVKSGILSVHLETPQGGTRVVRCCLPGDLVGESSVLDEDGATCNATVSAECQTALWRFEGPRLKDLIQELSGLKKRIEAARALHQLDSFFSMNEATDTLDVRVRDRLLSCIAAIRQVKVGEILGKEGQVPSAVYLIIDGRVEYGRGDVSFKIFGRDAFVGLSDTLHELPLEGDLIAVEACRLWVFDGQKLKKLAQDAPPEVIAVLERLG